MARVLIVDDTDIVRRALEVAVRRMGHVSLSASDPAEALALIGREVLDLALLDYQMPGMNGAMLLRRMRDQLGGRCPPVVFITAAPPEDVAREVEAAGAGGVFAYVKKPFHLEDLEARVSEALRPAAA